MDNIYGHIADEFPQLIERLGVVSTQHDRLSELAASRGECIWKDDCDLNPIADDLMKKIEAIAGELLA